MSEEERRSFALEEDAGTRELAEPSWISRSPGTRNTWARNSPTPGKSSPIRSTGTDSARSSTTSSTSALSRDAGRPDGSLSRNRNKCSEEHLTEDDCCWPPASALYGRPAGCARSGYTLRGKVVLITGGSRGLGLALAREASRHGARIAICGRDPEIAGAGPFTRW